MTRKIYSGMMLAVNSRTNIVSTKVVALRAANENEARGKMLTSCYNEMPTDEGYHSHFVDTFPVPEEWYIALES